MRMFRRRLNPEKSAVLSEVRLALLEKFGGVWADATTLG